MPVTETPVSETELYRGNILFIRMRVNLPASFGIMVEILDIKKDTVEIRAVAGDGCVCWIPTSLLYSRKNRNQNRN